MSATIKKFVLPSITIPILKGNLDDLGCPILTTTATDTTLTVTVDNTCGILFDFGNSAIKTINSDGSLSTEAVTLWGTSSPFTFITVFSSEFFYLQYSDAFYGVGRKYVFVYEKISSDKYYGAYGSFGGFYDYHEFYSISDVPLTKVGFSELYWHKQILNYAAPLGYIDYCIDLLFTSGDIVSSVIDTNTISCSTIEKNNVITFGSSNYYSLGPNTLIQLNNN